MSEQRASVRHTLPNSATIAEVFNCLQTQTSLLLVVSTM
jgi:hypothetical protein